MTGATTALSSEASAIVRAFADAEILTLAHVPSSAIASIILKELADAGKPGVPELLPVGREEEAVGIVGAMNLVGHRAALLMQDNGFGNALTALTTWAVAYHLPLPIFANERGGLGEYNSMIHAISGSARRLLETVGIPTFALSFRESAEEWHGLAVEAIDHAWLTRRPVVVFLNFWSGASG